MPKSNSCTVCGDWSSAVACASRAKRCRRACAVLAASDRRLANDLDGRRPGQQLMTRQPDLAHASRSEPLDQAVAADAHAVVQQVIADLQDRALTDRQRGPEHVAQLAKIAGPAIALQPLQRFVRDDRHGPPGLFGLAPEDVAAPASADRPAARATARDPASSAARGAAPESGGPRRALRPRRVSWTRSRARRARRAGDWRASSSDAKSLGEHPLRVPAAGAGCLPGTACRRRPAAACRGCPGCRRSRATTASRRDDARDN